MSIRPFFPDEDGSDGGYDESKFDYLDKFPTHVEMILSYHLRSIVVTYLCSLFLIITEF